MAQNNKEKDKILQLKKDIVFQKLFGSEENKEITSYFLSLILERNITNINLDVNKELIGDSVHEKKGILDVRAKFNNGEDVDIEIQLKKYRYMSKRVLTYWGLMYNQKLRIGNQYDKLKPSTMVLITDYRLNETMGIEEYHTIWDLIERKRTDRILTKDIEFHILELPKVKKIQKNDELGLWLKFIKNPNNKEVQEKMEQGENKYLKQAMEELKHLSNDPGFERLVQSREDFLRLHAGMEMEREEIGERRGVKRGRKEGEKRKTIEIAKNLIKMNLPIEQILQATGLTEDEIKKLCYV